MSNRSRRTPALSGAHQPILSTRRLCLWLLAGLLCSPAELPAQAANHSTSQSRKLPEFSYTEGWLGADDAYSIPLAPTESLWLFGDTFVGTTATTLRSQSATMVRNSIGISICRQGKPCTIRYFWQKRNDPKPRSFFDTGTDGLWYWPLDGFLSGKTLYVALLAVRNKPGAGAGDAFGFEIAGTRLATIDNPRARPEAWQIHIDDLTDAHLWAGVSLIADGDYVIWYTQVSMGEGKGFMTAMRVPREKVGNPTGHWEYLRKDSQWVTGLAGNDAMHVIEQPISEMSVRYHPSIKKWLALSGGPEFPSPRAVVRSADSPIGPWSSPQTVYEFPEMKRDNPGYDKDTFCYAVKEHIEFTDTEIALTYACNSMVVAKTMANMNIYRPRGVILELPK
ncbi:MAG: DUF4185 domain-containing protein [Candidatus Acidiferrales bacterium]